METNVLDNQDSTVVEQEAVPVEQKQATEEQEFTPAEQEEIPVEQTKAETEETPAERELTPAEAYAHEEGEVFLSGPIRFCDLFAFRLRSSYLGLNGISYWIITGLVAGLLIFNWNGYQTSTKVLLFFLLGLLILYLPGSMALRTLQYTEQCKADGLGMEYYVNSTGILAVQRATDGKTEASTGSGLKRDDSATGGAGDKPEGDTTAVARKDEQSVFFPWEAILKVKETGKRFYVYTTRRSAFVFGKDVLKEQTAAFRGFMTGASKGGK